jgi:hypothetical protein
VCCENCALPLIGENTLEVGGKHRRDEPLLISPEVVIVDLALLHISVFLIEPYIIQGLPRLNMRLIAI